MSDLLHQFHFLRPGWLLALLLLPALAWLGLRRGAAQVALERLVDPALLPHLLHGRAARRRLPLWLGLSGWTLVVLALAGPTWDHVEQPLYASRAPQVVAISLSQHMLARDVAPSRIARVRYKVHDLLAANRDGLNALIAYAGEAFVVAPLTSDANSLGDLLDALSPDVMPMGGDNAAAAIELAVKAMRDANAGSGSLVLVTDAADAAAEEAARRAAAAGIKVSVLGVGTPQGGPVPLSEGGFLRDARGQVSMAGRDDAALRALAAAGDGRYVPMAADQSDVEALQAELRPAPATLAAGMSGDQWRDRGPWLLLPLLPIVALAFRRGWLMLLPLVLLPLLPGQADASGWRDLWQRPDQQAAQALRQGDAARARQLARDPAWQAAAAYRAGDYAAAAKALEPLPGADAAYNLGNALARQGNYPGALDAYDRALKIDPSNEDTRFNRQLVEQMKKQQEQQSSGQQDGNRHEGHDAGDKSPPQGGGNGDKADPSSPSQGDGGKSPDQGDAAKQQDHDGEGQDRQDASRPQASGKEDAASQGQGEPQSADQKAAAEQARQALKQQMDQALAEQAKQASKESAHQLGRGDDAMDSKLPADLQHALQRVPDDPGALLRRKFELEYQQRHGGAVYEDGRP